LEKAGNNSQNAVDFGLVGSAGANGPGYRHSFHPGYNGPKDEDKKHSVKDARQPANYGAGAKKRMKSKKSGHKAASHANEGTGGAADHGFHQHFDQRNAPATAHHGIVGIKHQAANATGSSLPLVVKTAGGSQARARATTTGE
jgi:hypothetical protein